MMRWGFVFLSLALMATTMMWMREVEEPTSPPRVPQEWETWARSVAAESPGSEAALMIESIFKRNVGPETGWFTKPAQRKYDWPWLAARCSVSHDQSIGRRTHGISAALFKAIDRNNDGRLDRADFDWSRKTSSPPMTLPSRESLVKAIRANEIGSTTEGPNVGEQAPDFTLAPSDGGTKASLHQRLRQGKPVVLIFGNFTCGEFRRFAPELTEIFTEYKDRATFLGVYVREAHPTGGCPIGPPQDAEYVIDQPATYAERANAALKCSSSLKLPFPFLVDDLDDAVGRAYSGMPARLYVIGANGLVTFKSARAPFGFRPKEMRQALALTLLAAP